MVNIGQRTDRLHVFRPWRRGRGSQEHVAGAAAVLEASLVLKARASWSELHYAGLAMDAADAGGMRVVGRARAQAARVAPRRPMKANTKGMGFSDEARTVDDRRCTMYSGRSR